MYEMEKKYNNNLENKGNKNKKEFNNTIKQRKDKIKNME
jgi:hypothetical protein